MTTKDLVDIAQFALNVILAFFTVILFRQGQRDRRRVGEDRQREQASMVSMIRREVTQPTAGGGWSILAVTLEIRNDSALPVTGVRVMQGLQKKDREAPTWVELELDDNQMRGLTLAGGKVANFSFGADLVVLPLELHFVDGAGRSWVRRELDGTLWLNDYVSSPVRWWQNWYHRRAMGKFTKLFNWPIHYAFRRTLKTAPQVPFAARVARFLWGSATPAAPDPEPWRRSIYISERDWPYQNLISLAEFTRNNPPTEIDNRTQPTFLT